MGALLCIAVFLFHIVLGFTLYPGGAISERAIFDSDFVVFALPALLAIAGYFFALRLYPWFKRHWMMRIITSLVIAFLSDWCYMFICLNIYGS